MQEIRKTESLTKENFFNELYEKYPKGLQVFCDWIDRYKAENNWNKLFNADEIGSDSPYFVIGDEAPKFHDLPYAFQLGIWIEFVCERGGCDWEIEDMFTFNLRDDITAIIQIIDFDENIYI